MPLRTRVRASAHARSGRPTIANAGNPVSCTSASTSTRRGSRPTSACVTARASTQRRYAGNRDVLVDDLQRTEPDELAAELHRALVGAELAQRLLPVEPLDEVDRLRRRREDRARALVEHDLRRLPSELALDADRHRPLQL